MTYFGSDFFDYLQSPLSPAGNAPPLEVQVDVVGVTPPKTTSPHLPFRSANMRWYATDYLLDSTEATGRRAVEGSREKTLKLSANTSVTVGGDSGHRKARADDDEEDLFQWDFMPDDDADISRGGRRVSPTPSHIVSPSAPRDSPIGNASPYDRGYAYGSGAPAPTNSSPTLPGVIISPRTSPRHSATDDGANDDSSAAWENYMTTTMSPPTTPSGAGAYGTRQSTTEDEEGEGDALEDIYFADIMPMLLECGEAMQRHTERAQRLGGGDADRHEKGAGAAKRAHTGFLPPNLAPDEGGSPPDVPSTRVNTADPGTRHAYYLLSLSGSRSDGDDAAERQSAHGTANKWLGGYDGEVFYFSPDPPRPWAHVPAPPPLQQLERSTAAARAGTTAPSASPPTADEDWAAEASLLDTVLTPSEGPSVKRVVRRPSRRGDGGTRGNHPVVVPRRAVQMAAVQEMSGSELDDDAEEASKHDDHADSRERRTRFSEQTANTLPRDMGVSSKSVTADGTTSGDGAKGTTIANAAPPRLQTVLVMPNNAAPSSAVTGNGAFHTFAHLTARGALICNALSDTAARVVAGESATSMILHSASAATAGMGRREVAYDRSRTPAHTGLSVLAEMASFFSSFFQNLARRTAQVDANTFCAQASVVVLKQDMYRDLMQSTGASGYQPLVLSGTPLLGPRLGGATLCTLLSCARTMELLTGAMSRLVADDFAAGVVLVSVYVKQTVETGTRAKSKRRAKTQKDVLLSSYSAVIGCPQAVHDAAVSNLYPLTRGLIQRCFRGAVLPSLIASLYEMTLEEQRIATDLVEYCFEQFRPAAPHQGSVTKLLATIHRLAKVFHGMLWTAREESDVARQAWWQACDEVSAAQARRTQSRPRSRSGSGAPHRDELKRMTRLHKAYQKRHRRWLRLDFLLRSLAGIATDCESTLQSSVQVLPPVYLFTSHYLRQPDSKRGGGVWTFVSRASGWGGGGPAAHTVRFASNQPLYASDSEDDEAYVPANTPFGEHKLVFPFPFRQPRGGQPRSLGEPELPLPMDATAVNLFSGGYTEPMCGIRALLDPSDSHVRRLFGLPPLYGVRSPSSSAALLPCTLRVIPDTPQVCSVIWLNHRATPAAVTTRDKDDTYNEDEDGSAKDVAARVEVCAQLLDCRTVLAGSRLAQRRFTVDEVCARNDTDQTDPQITPLSPSLTNALTEFTGGANTHVYYTVTTEPNTDDRRDRLRHIPLWFMLRYMVSAVLDKNTSRASARSERRVASTTSSAARRDRSASLSSVHSTASQSSCLFMSSCHISTSADLVSDHFCSTSADAASSPRSSALSAPQPQSLRPFRAAWTAAGPVVEGCRYVVVDSTETFERHVNTIMTRTATAAASKRNADVHVRLSFLLHQPTQGDVLLSSLTVWLTTNPILFASLGVQTSVPLFHKLNLLRPHYCRSVVYVADIAVNGSSPDACAAALWHQSELRRMLSIPLFPCIWSLRRYLQYLSDRQLAFRTSATLLLEQQRKKEEEEAETAASKNATRSVAPPPFVKATVSPPTQTSPVYFGTTVSARLVMDACGMLERMRSVVVSALEADVDLSPTLTALATATSISKTGTVSLRGASLTSPMSAAGAAADGVTTRLARILALSSDGCGVYNISAPAACRDVPIEPPPPTDPPPMTAPSATQPSKDASRSARAERELSPLPLPHTASSVPRSPSLSRNGRLSQHSPAPLVEPRLRVEQPLRRAVAPRSSRTSSLLRSPPPLLTRLPTPLKSPSPWPEITVARRVRAGEVDQPASPLSPLPATRADRTSPIPQGPSTVAKSRRSYVDSSTPVPATARTSSPTQRRVSRRGHLNTTTPTLAFASAPSRHVTSVPQQVAFSFAANAPSQAITANESESGASNNTPLWERSGDSLATQSATVAHVPAVPTSTRKTNGNGANPIKAEKMINSVPVLPHTTPTTAARSTARASSVVL